MVVQKNSCGTCRECCKFLTITAPQDNNLQAQRVKKWITGGKETKVPPTPCPSLNPSLLVSGCSIHKEETKPELCNTYLCLYALGSINNKSNRPDNCGLIIDAFGDRKVFRIVETKEEALEKNKELLWNIHRAGHLLGEEWAVEIIPYNLIGTDTGTRHIISEAGLSIGKKNDNK